MNAVTRQILNGIKYKGITPLIIESVDRIFVLDYVSKYSVSGYVCGIIGEYRPKFKQVKIQTMTNGTRYVIADRRRFDMDTLRTCKLNREVITRELTLTENMRNFILNEKKNGVDVGFALENQNFYINNLTKYLDMTKQGTEQLA